MLKARKATTKTTFYKGDVFFNNTIKRATQINKCWPKMTKRTQHDQNASIPFHSGSGVLGFLIIPLNAQRKHKQTTAYFEKPKLFRRPRTLRSKLSRAHAPICFNQTTNHRGNDPPGLDHRGSQVKQPPCLSWPCWFLRSGIVRINRVSKNKRCRRRFFCSMFLKYPKKYCCMPLFLLFT